MDATQLRHASGLSAQPLINMSSPLTLETLLISDSMEEVAFSCYRVKDRVVDAAGADIPDVYGMLFHRNSPCAPYRSDGRLVRRNRGDPAGTADQPATASPATG